MQLVSGVNSEGWLCCEYARSELDPVSARLALATGRGKLSPRILGGGDGGGCRGGGAQVEATQVAQEVEAGRGGGCWYHRCEVRHRGGERGEGGDAGNLQERK